MQDNNAKPRKRARTRAEWMDLYRSIRHNASDFEREVIRFALRMRDEFPTPEYEVRRVINEARSQDETAVQQQSVSSSKGIDLDRIFKETKNERSLNYLTSISAPTNYNPRPSLEQLRDSFKRNSYFVSEDDLFTIHQAISGGRPIKVDGPSGVGKTELAKQIAIAMGLQINNPLHFGELFVTPDVSKEEAFYRWNDALRLIDMQLISGFANRMDNSELQRVYEQVSDNTYSPRYLDLQVLVRACVLPYSTVCLVDEIDKAYHEFDNYLLGIVDQNHFVIPEIGRVGRKFHDPVTAPIFVLTSNMTRALSGPLVRRCKAVFYDYLDETLEAKVIQAKTNMNNLDSGKVAAFFKKIRRHEKLRLQQPPSTAEVIETAKALMEHKLSVSEQNLFKLHGHWIKYRVDYIQVSDLYLKSDGSWSNGVN
jgi:MoxR-like ATPase